MQLSLRDAARLLEVAERKLVRAIDVGELRAQRVADQLRCNRAELLEWATLHRIAVPPELLKGAGEPVLDDDGRPQPSLSDALAAGGVHRDVPGRDRDEVLRAVVARWPLPAGADREFFLSFLRAREDSGSTALGDGIAIPHVRAPLVLQGARPLATLCYLATPVDFRAPDGVPVHTVFSLVTGTVRSHLHLLSTLGCVLQDATTRAALQRRGSADEILAAVRSAELRRLDQKPERPR